MKQPGNVFHRHGPHLLFGLTLASLCALLIWWSLFIHSSIRLQRDLLYETYRLDLRNHAGELGRDAAFEPRIGDLPEDDRFEIVPRGNGGREFCVPLDPLRPEFCLRMRPEVLQEVEVRFHRQNLMLVGEAAFFFLLFLVCIIFLFRFIQLERRAALEVRAFWDRSAHELKTPITGLKAFLQNLRASPEDLESLVPNIDLALKQIERQEKMAENILAGFRLKDKDRAIKTEFLDLPSFLHFFFESSTLKLVGADVRFDFPKGRSLVVRAHKRSLEIILDNIIDNAVKYGPVSLKLEVTIRESGDTAIVCVKDNGPGFAPDKTEALFEAFKHPDQELPDTRHGSGMGLFISRRTARAMGARLTAASDGPGRGAEFRLSLRKAN